MTTRPPRARDDVGADDGLAERSRRPSRSRPVAARATSSSGVSSSKSTTASTARESREHVGALGLRRAPDARPLASRRTDASLFTPTTRCVTLRARAGEHVHVARVQEVEDAVGEDHRRRCSSRASAPPAPATAPSVADRRSRSERPHRLRVEVDLAHEARELDELVVLGPDLDRARAAAHVHLVRAIGELERIGEVAQPAARWSGRCGAPRTAPPASSGPRTGRSASTSGRCSSRSRRSRPGSTIDRRGCRALPCPRALSPLRLCSLDDVVDDAVDRLLAALGLAPVRVLALRL